MLGQILILVLATASCLANCSIDEDLVCTLPLPILCPPPPIELPFCSATPTSSVPSCSVSSDDFPSGRAQVGSIVHSSVIPSWANQTRARLGQLAANKYEFSNVVGAAFGLLSVFLVPDIKTVLLFSNHSESSEEATKRYIATATHVAIWMQECYKKDTTDLNAFMKSISGVRDVHRNVSYNATTHGSPLYAPGTFDNLPINELFWNAVHADLDASNVPTLKRAWPTSYTQYDSSTLFVNQFSLGMTQFGFIGYPMIRSTEIFLPNLTEDEQEGLVHLWALIAYGLGIDDAYNICLQHNMTSLLAYFNDIQEKYYIPALFHIARDIQVLFEAILGIFDQFYPVYVSANPLLPLPPYGEGAGYGLVYLYLRDIMKINNLNNTYGNLTMAGQGFVQGWDNGLRTFAMVPGSNTILAQTLVAPLQAGILAYFGPYVTNDQRAENVYYPPRG